MENSAKKEVYLDLTKFIVPDEKGNFYRVKYLEGEARNQYLDSIDEPHADKPLTKNDLIALYGFALDTNAIKAAREVSANFAELNESQKMDFGYKTPWNPRFYAKAFGPIQWKVAKSANETVANSKKTINIYRVGVVYDGLEKSEEERNSCVSDWYRHQHFTFSEEQVNGSGWKWEREKIGLENMDALSKFVQQMSSKQIEPKQNDLGSEK